MRLAVAGSPEVAIPTLNTLLSSEYELVRVISQPDKPAGRGKVLTATPVSQWAIENNIELVQPTNAEELKECIHDVDCVLTIGYGLLLPEDVLNIPHHGFLNLHFSLLPRWRGAAPVQRAIEAGDPVTGVTVFKLDPGMDTGPIYTIHRFALDSDITSDELFLELGELGVDAVLATLEKVSKGERPIAQPVDGATRARKLSREEGRIDWNKSAEEVSAHIRAFTSQPGAWTHFRGTPLKIAAPTLSDHMIPAGAIALIDKKLYIGTSTSALEIATITPQGKKSMSAAAWANGARLVDGDSFE